MMVAYLPNSSIDAFSVWTIHPDEDELSESDPEEFWDFDNVLQSTTELRPVENSPEPTHQPLSECETRLTETFGSNSILSDYEEIADDEELHDDIDGQLEELAAILGENEAIAVHDPGENDLRGSNSMVQSTIVFISNSVQEMTMSNWIPLVIGILISYWILIIIQS